MFTKRHVEMVNITQSYNLSYPGYNHHLRWRGLSFPGGDYGTLRAIPLPVPISKTTLYLQPSRQRCQVDWCLSCSRWLGPYCNYTPVVSVRTSDSGLNHVEIKHSLMNLFNCELLLLLSLATSSFALNTVHYSSTSMVGFNCSRFCPMVPCYRYLSILPPMTRSKNCVCAYMDDIEHKCWRNWVGSSPSTNKLPSILYQLTLCSIECTSTYLLN
jgi:hypothetical protein